MRREDGAGYEKDSKKAQRTTLTGDGDGDGRRGHRGEEDKKTYFIDMLRRRRVFVAGRRMAGRCVRAEVSSGCPTRGPFDGVSIRQIWCSLAHPQRRVHTVAARKGQTSSSRTSATCRQRGRDLRSLGRAAAAVPNVSTVSGVGRICWRC